MGNNYNISGYGLSSYLNPGDGKKKKDKKKKAKTHKDLGEQDTFIIDGQPVNPYEGKSYHHYPASQEYKDFVGDTTPMYSRTFGDKMYDIFHSQPRVTTKFGYGGQVGPQYEAEKGEVVDGGIPKVYNGGNITQNSSQSAKINGNTHEQGGVDMSGGQRIFSDRIYVDSNFLKDLDI